MYNKDGKTLKAISEDERLFSLDALIYHFYYEIVEDERFPKHVPLLEIPVEIIHYIIAEA